jgi:hypothetical protein
MQGLLNLRLIMQTLLSPSLWLSFFIGLLIIALFNIITINDFNRLEESRQQQWLQLIVEQQKPQLIQGISNHDLLLLQAIASNLAQNEELLMGIEILKNDVALVKLGQASELSKTIQPISNSQVVLHLNPQLHNTKSNMITRDSLFLVLIAFIASFFLSAWRKLQENAWWQQRLDNAEIEAGVLTDILENGSHLQRMNQWLDHYSHALRLGRQLEKDLPEAIVHRLSWISGRYQQQDDQIQEGLLLSIAIKDFIFDAHDGAYQCNRLLKISEKLAILYDAHLSNINGEMHLFFNHRKNSAISDESDTSAQSSIESALRAATLIRDICAQLDINVSCTLTRTQQLLYRNKVTAPQICTVSDTFHLSGLMHKYAQSGQILLQESLFEEFKPDDGWLLEMVRDMVLSTGEVSELWQLTDIPANEQALLLNQATLLIEN